MDCCVGGEPAEPVETHAVLKVDDHQVAGELSRLATFAERPRAGTGFEGPAAGPPDGRPLFLLHAVFRL